MRSELDVTTTKDRVIGILSIIGGILFVAILVTTMVYDKQRRENMTLQDDSTIAGLENSESGNRIDGNDIGLLHPGEQIAGEEMGEGVSEQAEPGEEIAANTYRLPDKETVTFTFAGDVLLDDSYAVMGSYHLKGDVLEECVEPALLSQMREADVCVVNNEFTYTESSGAIPNKTFTFRAKPENVSILKEMGVDAVSLANNHVYDFGEKGLFDTLDTLENAGIRYTGAGRNLEEASQILYYKNDSICISLICATQIERYATPNTKGATATTPGTFRCYESEELLKKIEEAEANSDFVIVFLHWGTESTTELDWRQTSQAKECAEAGADVIVGAHPHVIQGIGYEGNVPVFYSLGNYWFSSKELDSALLTLEIGETGLVSAWFQPCLTRGCSTLEATGAEKDRVLALMRSLSPNAKIDDNGYVTPLQY